MRTENILLILLMVTLFTSLLYKASVMGITHDEAFTYTRYVHHSYFQILTYSTGSILPNNHILNTIFQKFFTSILPESEFALRLGNILCTAIFFLAAFLISKKFFTGLALPTFIILVLHPYILDFMSLSRGYGMAISFMLLSLYFILSSISNDFDLKNLIAGLGAAIFTVLANLSWLNFFDILCTAYLLVYMLFRKPLVTPANKSHSTKVIALLLSSFTMASILVFKPLKEIMIRKQLFGGSNGFWEDTVHSLAERFSYEAAYASFFISVFKWVIIIVLALVLLRIIIPICKKEIPDRKTIFLASLLFGMVLMSIFQVKLMHSFYPMERTALGFVPIILLLLLFTFGFENEKFRLPGRIFLYSISFMLAVHAFLNFKLNYVLDWKYDANTREIVQDIIALPEDTIKLGVHPLHEPAVNFYRQIWTIKKFDAIPGDGYRKEGEYEYFVVPQADEPKITNENLIALKKYHPGESTLARKSDEQ